MNILNFLSREVFSHHIRPTVFTAVELTVGDIPLYCDIIFIASEFLDSKVGL
jgi:hypothetical protein